MIESRSPAPVGLLAFRPALRLAALVALVALDVSRPGSVPARSRCADVLALLELTARLGHPPRLGFGMGSVGAGGSVGPSKTPSRSSALPRRTALSELLSVRCYRNDRGARPSCRASCFWGCVANRGVPSGRLIRRGHSLHSRWAFARSPEVVACLHVEPHLGAGAKRALEAQRHRCAGLCIFLMEVACQW